MDTAQKLARLQNRRTLYEIAGMLPDGRTVLVMYSGKSLAQVAGGMRSRYDRLAPVMGESIWIAKDVESRGPGCVWITGRTQREAIMEGELPYVFAEAKAA